MLDVRAHHDAACTLARLPPMICLHPWRTIWPIARPEPGSEAPAWRPRQTEIYAHAVGRCEATANGCGVFYSYFIRVPCVVRRVSIHCTDAPLDSASILSMTQHIPTPQTTIPSPTKRLKSTGYRTRRRPRARRAYLRTLDDCAPLSAVPT